MARILWHIRYHGRMDSRPCECGCGQVVVRTRDQLARFIRGHNLRKHHPPWWKGDAAGYGAKHHYLNKHFPRSGVCEECGESKQTGYALIHGRQLSRDRSDYRELCWLCHNRYDHAVNRGPAPACKCGCGQAVTWRSASRGGWHVYVEGHYRNPVMIDG